MSGSLEGAVRRSVWVVRGGQLPLRALKITNATNLMLAEAQLSSLVRRILKPSATEAALMPRKSSAKRRLNELSMAATKKQKPSRALPARAPPETSLLTIFIGRRAAKNDVPLRTGVPRLQAELLRHWTYILLMQCRDARLHVRM